MDGRGPACLMAWMDTNPSPSISPSPARAWRRCRAITARRLRCPPAATGITVSRKRSAAHQRAVCPPASHPSTTLTLHAGRQAGKQGRLPLHVTPHRSAAQSGGALLLPPRSPDFDAQLHQDPGRCWCRWRRRALPQRGTEGPVPPLVEAPPAPALDARPGQAGAPPHASPAPLHPRGAPPIHPLSLRPHSLRRCNGRRLRQTRLRSVQFLSF